MSHLTYDKLYQKFLATGDRRLLDEYEVISRAILQSKYSWFYSLSTPDPLSDPIEAEKCCVKIYDRVTTTLYGRRKPEIPYVSFIERGKNLPDGKQNYHIHLLVGDAVNTHVNIQDFPECLKKTPRALIRKMGLKVRYGFYQKGVFNFPIHEREVYKDEGVVDYLLKGIENQSYRICYHASNLDWRNCDKNIAVESQQ